MSSLLVIVLAGIAGGLLFHVLGVPGGPMTGSILAVIIVKCLIALPPASIPRPVQVTVYICLGIIVGNMFKPEMLLVVGNTWPVLIFSTLIILAAGIVSAIMVVHLGKLDPPSAYLATTPGGLNVVLGLAADMGPNAPIVMAYQMVRLYTIILTVPIAVKLLTKLVNHV